MKLVFCVLIVAVVFSSCSKEDVSAYENIEMFGFQTMGGLSEAFHYDLADEVYQYTAMPNYRENTVVFDESENLVGYSDLMGEYVFASTYSVLPVRRINMGQYLSQVALDVEDNLLIGSYYDSLGWHLKVIDSYSSAVKLDTLTALESVVPGAYFYKQSTNEYFLQKGDDNNLVCFSPDSGAVSREIVLDKRFSTIEYVREKDWAVGLAYDANDVYITTLDVTEGEVVKSVVLKNSANYKKSHMVYYLENNQIVLFDYENRFCFIDAESGGEEHAFEYMTEADLFYISRK